VTAALGVAVLCSLGFWQIQRLHWKQALLAEIASRQSAAPISLSAALALAQGGGDIEFRRIAAEVKFQPATEFRMLAAFDGRPGWQIVSPAVSQDGIFILVDRGAVPEELRNDSSRRAVADHVVTLEGVVRQHRNGRGPFTPDNDPAGNIWYWWDVPAMLGAANAPPGAKVAPFVLQLMTSGDAVSSPRPTPPDVGIHNYHLQYAITWFSLAGVLAVIAGLFIRGQARRAGA
jgi:surfeit locus 1 family protein